MKPVLNNVDLLGKNYFESILCLLFPNLKNAFNIWWDNSDITLQLQTSLLISNIHGTKLEIDEKNDKTKETVRDSDLSKSKEDFQELLKLDIELTGIVYDKDIEQHIDTMVHLVNLRAASYKIKPKIKSK